MTKIISQPDTPVQRSLLDLLPENQPHPIILSQKYNFPLSYIDIDGNPDNYLYHIPQWVKGIGSTLQSWSMLKKQGNDVFNTVEKVKFEGIDGKMYPTDFGNANILYLIAEHIQPTKVSEQLIEIREYLAATGVAVDSARRNPEPPKTKKQRKLERDLGLIDKVWADNHEGRERIQLQIDVIKSYQVLQQTVKDMVDNPNYGHLTNTEYMNLFGYTAQGLKNKLNSKDIRSDLATMALSNLRHAETMLAGILRMSSGNLTMGQTKAIYDSVLKPIGETFDIICQEFGIDGITGKPLLPSGK